MRFRNITLNIGTHRLQLYMSSHDWVNDHEAETYVATFAQSAAESVLSDEDWEEDNTLNYGGWENRELERLTEAYLGAKDDDRAQAVRDWLQLLTTTTVILPVCFETRDVISHLGTLSGMSPNQYDIFHNITAWTVHIG